MNRKLARNIAETISNEQLGKMFNDAKVGIEDWTKVSSVNKGMTKGLAWNILAKNFDINKKYHILAKVNMVREFGDYLTSEFKPQKESKKVVNPIHQEPQF